jgi:hypothetical protein
MAHMPSQTASDTETIYRPDQDSVEGNAGDNTGMVDLERLVDKVYRLMQADVRLERNRSGRIAGRSWHDS